MPLPLTILVSWFTTSSYCPYARNDRSASFNDRTIWVTYSLDEVKIHQY